MNNNGQGKNLIAEMLVTPAPKSIIDELSALECEIDDLQRFALDNVGRLAELDRYAFVQFCTILKDRGVSPEWMRVELRPAVNEERRKLQGAITWTNYVEAAKDLGYTFRLNDLDDKLEVNGERLTDVIEAAILSRLHARQLRNVDVARRAFITEAAANRYHPVKEYLEKLKWDGKDHIAELSAFLPDAHSPITYPDGTKRTAFHAFFRRWGIGAIAKVYDSRSGQNAMFILDGIQGKGKSYFVKWVCSPLPELHFEGAIKPDDKDYLGYLTTRWIWEVGELGATMRRADREALKAFVTLQEATYRPSYGRYPLHKPALASFIGTVNLEGELLNDPTGHRRFWPVNITNIDWTYTKKIDINQVWAQAYALYRAGEPWRLSNEEHRAHQEITALYEVEDILEGHIYKWFDVAPGNEEMYSHTTDIIHILRTYGDVKGADRSLSMQLAITLKKMGLEKRKRNNVWGYVGLTQKTDSN